MKTSVGRRWRKPTQRELTWEEARNAVAVAIAEEADRMVFAEVAIKGVVISSTQDELERTAFDLQRLLAKRTIEQLLNAFRGLHGPQP